MELTNAAKNWAQKVVELHALKVPPHLEPRKRKLLRHAEIIKKSLEATDPLRPLAPVASELGFIPLLIGGGIIAVTAMSKWAKDAYQIKTEKEQYDALIASGVSAAKAQQIMAGNKINWQMLLGIPAVLIGGFLTYKMIGRRKNGNR